MHAHLRHWEKALPCKKEHISIWGTVWKPLCGWQLHVKVSLGIHYSLIPFFSSSSSRPGLSPTASIWLLLGLWSIKTIRIRAVGHDARCRLSLYARFGVFLFQDLLLNSFKHILDNTVAPHGMKIECFLPFDPSKGVKILA